MPGRSARRDREVRKAIRKAWAEVEARFLPGGFLRYRIGAGTLSRDQLGPWCKAVNDYQAKRDLVSPFSIYQRLCDLLATDRRFDVRPLARLMAPIAEGRVAVALRHDVDADICTALRAAAELVRRGLPGSFYLLHTAGYYGDFKDHIFRRQPALTSIIEDLLETNCEIGLHSDALSIYCEHGINGAAAIKTEIAWLRRQGANIQGTVAHNSAVLYGAENFEIFRNRALGGRRSFAWGERRVPLQVLDEKALGLTYEGNYPLIVDHPDEQDPKSYLAGTTDDEVRSASWQRKYFLHNPVFERDYDVSIWLLARDSWVIARHTARKDLHWPVSTERVLSFLKEADPGSRLVFNIHPEYVASD